MAPLPSQRRLAAAAAVLCLCGASAAGEGSRRPEVPVTEVEGAMDYQAVKCAACDFLVDHLNGLASTALMENKVVPSVRRSKKSKKSKKMKAIKDVPWLQSELGWGEAVDNACEYANLKDLAYLAKGGQYKLLSVNEMSPAMAEMAQDQVLARDPSAYRQFQTACQDIVDENDRAVVKVRTVCTACDTHADCVHSAVRLTTRRCIQAMN